ncbi:MAG: LysR family transcriptional regulator [Rhizobiaceae bacterium]
MNWDDLKIFLAVARAGQLLGAAKRLGLNHATVARRVTALEQATGGLLFHRQTSGSTLTSAGERLLEIAERIEAEINGAQAAVAPAEAAIAGTVRIGAPDGFGVAFLAPHLAGLTEKHPSLQVQLVPVPRSFSLSRHEADIAITVDRPSEGRLVASKLVDYSLQLFASKTYAARHGKPQTAENLSEHRLVGYVSDLVINPSLDYASEFSAEWSASFQISSTIGQVEAVRAGAGIGILHSFIGRAHDDLIALDLFEPVRRAYWIVYHESARSLPQIRAAVSFIQQTVSANREIFA